MKKINYILGSALIIITLCMIYLVLKGVSLRSEPIIKPSPVGLDYKNITYGLVHRMFPSFQKTDYVVWGLDPDSESEQMKIFELLKTEYARLLGAQPQVIKLTDTTDDKLIITCKNPCWILVPNDKASQLQKNDLLQKIQALLGKNYFSFTFLEFQRGMSVPAICETEQRLDFACLLPVAVREVSKYFKKSDIRYFFTRRYNEVDYFLFIEKNLGL